MEWDAEMAEWDEEVVELWASLGWNKAGFGLSLLSALVLFSVLMLFLFVYVRKTRYVAVDKNVMKITVYFDYEVSGFPMLGKAPYILNWAWNSLWFPGNW